jgi:hypothetical protein
MSASALASVLAAGGMSVAVHAQNDVPAAIPTVTTTTQSRARSCDRACLEGFVDKYLDAVLAHDPTKVPLARNVKFTENGQKLEPGDGLWRTMTARGTYRMFVTDTQAGRVSFLGSIKEADISAMLAVHLRVKGGQVTEAETLVQRNEKSGPGFEKIGYTWLDPIPPNERMSRDELIRTTDLYFTGMAKNDGKGNYPFTDDCHRIENGTHSTNAPRAKPAPTPKPPPDTPASGAAKSNSKAACCTSSPASATAVMSPSTPNAASSSSSPSSTTPPATPAPSRPPTAAPSPPAPRNPGPGTSPKRSASKRAKSTRSPPSWNACPTA